MNPSPTPSWSSEYAGVPQIVGSSDGEEWTCWQGESDRQRVNASLPHPYIGCLQKVWPRLEMGLPTSNNPRLKVCLSISKTQIRSGSSHFKLSKNLSQVCHTLGFS